MLNDDSTCIGKQNTLYIIVAHDSPAEASGHVVTVLVLVEEWVLSFIPVE